METNAKLIEVLQLVLQLNETSEYKWSYDLHCHVDNIHVYALDSKKNWIFDVRSYFAGDLMQYNDQGTVPLNSLISQLKSIL